MNDKFVCDLSEINVTRPTLARLTLNQLRVCISFLCFRYESGHICDQPDLFIETNRPFDTEYQFGCEPYTVVPRTAVHLYEEGFVGYGKDRVSWNYELAARGAKFKGAPPDANIDMIPPERHLHRNKETQP